jgi:type VI protein secretion system component VasK
VISNPGQGTTVTLSLPLYQRPESEYRQRAVVWALMAAVWVIMLFVNRGDIDVWASPSLAWIVLSVIGLTRQFIALRRVRQQQESVR